MNYLGLQPNFKGVQLSNSTCVITGGTTTGSVAIAAQILGSIGVPADGSVYLSSYGAGEVWVKVAGVWTSLTIN
jgi:hypothetical protein